MNPYILTVFSNLAFAIGSQFFTHYTRKFSSVWMNSYKALIALICFLVTVLITGGFHSISFLNMGLFFLSGMIGLGIGDIFLFNAFKELGPGRTMVLFGFDPIIVGILSFFIFGQVLDFEKLWGIIFFVLCLLTFSFENFRLSGNWEFKGLLYAFIGMFFDASGVIITRYAFEMNHEISAFEGNVYRCVGALFFYFVLRGFSPFKFRERFFSLENKSKIFVTVGAMLGTYLSLSLYLYAIKHATSLATVTAISITSVIFSSTIECVWDKRRPTPYLFTAFLFFAVGMWVLLF